MAGKQRILDQSEIQTLLNQCEEGETSKQQDQMMIKTCLYPGLRNEETVSLQRKHVEQLQGDASVFIEEDNTKTSNGERSVPTPDKFMEEFKDYVEEKTEDQEDYLFPSPRTSSHVSTRYFQDLMKDNAWDGGLYPYLENKEDITQKLSEEERVRPHALRHTYGTRSYEKGVPPKELSDLMGHKNMQITLDLYAHLATERSRPDINNVW